MQCYSKEKSLNSLPIELLIGLIKQMDLNSLMEFRKTNKTVNKIF